MLFCSAPITTEIVQMTIAPSVPSAPIEAPRAASRKPGLASATMNPSHQDMALMSSRSSTWAVAMRRPFSKWAQTDYSPRRVSSDGVLYQLVHERVKQPAAAASLGADVPAGEVRDRLAVAAAVDRAQQREP